VLEEAMRQVSDLVSGALLGGMREVYPRLTFVSDRVLLEALAVACDPGALPPALLGSLFNGLQRLVVAAPHEDLTEVRWPEVSDCCLSILVNTISLAMWLSFELHLWACLTFPVLTGPCRVLEVQQVQVDPPPPQLMSSLWRGPVVRSWPLSLPCPSPLAPSPWPSSCWSWRGR
jgi:hypothetical protein